MVSPNPEKAAKLRKKIVGLFLLLGFGPAAGGWGVDPLTGDRFKRLAR